MDWRSLWRLAGPVVLAGLAIPVDAQAPASRPPDLFVTRLQGTTTTGPTTSIQAIPPRATELSPFPVTKLDERLQNADLDGPRRISLTVSRAMPLRDLLLLLVNGTPLSLVADEAVDGTFLGELNDLTMRQAVEAVLFPRGLDYDVQGTLVRVFPRRASTRLFDVNYLNVRRTLRRGLRSASSIDDGRSSTADLSTSSESDRFEALASGVQALLSASGRMHVDREAGLVQVTDFADRLDLVGIYVEAAQVRAMRQVRIETQIFDVTFADGGASAIDWQAVRSRAGAGTRSPAGHGAAGLMVADTDRLKQAIAEQGTVTMIAAPEIVAMNNEPAVIQAGTGSVYVANASKGWDGNRRERMTGPGTVLEGLSLSITAQMSADGFVLLNVAPTYTTRTGQSKSADGETFPVLHISETDTMLRVQDGETIVLSGFLESRQGTKPATGLSAMFGTQLRTTVKSELVILLTPRIVGPGTPALGAAR
jgi:type II secretory pathway component HofQ